MAERNIGDEIIEGLENAVAYAEGDKTRGEKTVVFVPPTTVKSIPKERKIN